VHDVAIIGAGPAGCIAAISLAHRSHHVALIEQHRFPRDKVCGECLSAVGIDVLSRLRLRESVSALRPTHFTRAELIAPSGETATIHLPRPMWGLSRHSLDATLLDSAREAGVQILQPARCESVDAIRGEVVIRDLRSNATQTIAAHYILVADGKAACGLAHPSPTTDLGIKAHFTNVRSATDAIALFGVCGHYVGLAPIESAHWNIAMSVPSSRVRQFHGDLDAMFANLLEENVELRRRMKHAARVSDWLASPLPRFAVNSHWPARVIPVGNAAAALEPIGGEGMGLAMRSAELAAEAVIAALRNNRPVDNASLRREFNRLWRVRRVAARAIALMMSSPGCAELLVSAINSIGLLPRPALVPLGK
jgi:flavin-dependent dehydrogenase